MTTYERIVAVFDTVDHEERAIRELIDAGIARNAIETHDRTARDTWTRDGTVTGTTATTTTTREPAAARGVARENAPHTGGFWDALFGTDVTETDRTVYDRSIEAGSRVLSVTVTEAEADKVIRILDKYAIDIDERATSYGLRPTPATTATTTTTTTARTAPTAAPAAPARETAAGGKLELAEEQLQVAKRPVTRGTTRLRRYVVAQPVEADVRLREEDVAVERRPVNRPITASDDAFTEKSIQATEHGEEAVVGKTARVVEEVGLRKKAAEHVEHVRDTVRKDEVEVEKDADRARRPGRR